MEEIQVRLIEKEDFASLFEVIEKNRSRLLKYFPATSAAISDIEAAKKFVLLKLRQAAKREQLYFVVISKNTSKIIGSVILKNLDWNVPKGELAYFVDADYEGTGITSRAVKWLVQYAFDELKIEKLYIKCSPDNTGSKQVAIKNGFLKEGHMKREYRTGEGLLTDMERYGLLK
jgi:ribosomal-protein-serine acetyltransferase